VRRREFAVLLSHCSKCVGLSGTALNGLDLQKRKSMYRKKLWLLGPRLEVCMDGTVRDGWMSGIAAFS